MKKKIIKMIKKLIITLFLIVTSIFGYGQVVYPGGQPCATHVPEFTFYYSKPVTNSQVLGSLNACDPDINQTLTWSIPVGNSGNLWGITNAIPGNIIVNDATAINGGTQTTYNITVRITDNGSNPGPLYAESIVHLIETNGAPVINNQTFMVNENSPNGTTVGTVVATDPNNQPLTYSIISGNSNNTFSINPTTGVISVQNTSALNYEAQPAYALIVQVIDTGTAPLSAQATITVTVIDVNEPPVIY